MKKYTVDEIVALAQFAPREIISKIGYNQAKNNENFLMMYADIGKSYGVDKIASDFPEKCIEVGIAEQNLVGMAAGLSNLGFDVFAFSYAPFITSRVLDQIRVFLGYMQSNVRLVGIGGGLTAGDLGATHTALEDIAVMRTIPNMVVVSPCDCLEYAKVIEALDGVDSPVYIRLTGGKVGETVYDSDYDFQIGKGVVLQEGKRIAIISNGNITKEVSLAVEKLKEFGVLPMHINMHTIKPLDTALIDTILDMEHIVTVEEHNVLGGLGGAVAEHLAEKSNHPKLTRIGVNDQFFKANRASVLREKAGLTCDKLVEKVLSILEIK